MIKTLLSQLYQFIWGDSTCMHLNSRPSMTSLYRAVNDPASKHYRCLTESSVDLVPFWRSLLNEN